MTTRVLALRHAMSTDRTRENLYGMRIEADGTAVAADGHVLAFYRPAQAIADGDGALEAPIFLPPDAVARAWKDRAADPEVDVPETLRNGHVRIAFRSGSFDAPKMDTTYPEWRQIVQRLDESVPAETSGFSIGISAHVLEKIAKIRNEWNRPERCRVAPLLFRFLDEMSGFSASCRSDDGEELRILAMPCRL